MSRIPLAVQLYSVREECAKDLPGVLRAVAAMGYEGVEFAGFHEHAAEDVRAMLDQHSLKCAGSHARLETLTEGQFDQTVAYHKTIGCGHVVVPWLPEERRDSESACMATAALFTSLTNALAEHDMLAGYHCHGFDVKPINGGASDWELIATHTPANFIMQYDTGNGMEGGADPVEPIRRHPGRAVTLHLKEFNAGSDAGHGMSAVGDGDVPWADVFAAAREVGGTKWYIVEQEGHTTLSPMDAIARGIENLHAMGL